MTDSNIRLNPWEQQRLAWLQVALQGAIVEQIRELTKLQTLLFGSDGELLTNPYPQSGVLPYASTNSLFGSKPAYPVNTELAKDIRDGCQIIYNALENYNALVEGYCSGRVGEETP